MAWFNKKRKAQALEMVEEGIKAKEQSGQRLEEAKNRLTRTRVVASTARRVNVRNHFTESFTEAILRGN